MASSYTIVLHWPCRSRAETLLHDSIIDTSSSIPTAWYNQKWMFISLSYVCVTIETFIRAMEIHRIRIQKANKRVKRRKNPQSIVQNGQYFLLKLCDYPEPNRFRSLVHGESNGAAFVTLSPLIIATRFKFVLTCWFASCNRNLGVLRQMAPCLLCSQQLH